MRLSYRQRLVAMGALLVLFMVGLALQNTVNELLGIGVCAVAFVLSALIVFRMRAG